MPDLTPLAALFKLRPDRAADYLLAKGFKLSGPYWELDGPAHSHVFTVANLAKLDVLADIKGAVQQAIDEGRTEKWFKDNLVGVLQRKGWWGPGVSVDPVTMEAKVFQQGSLRRLQTIYRTNLQSAYMAGRHRQALEQIDQAPWAQYLAIRDQRSRPAHAALHGQVFRLDSPAWAVIAPTNGYNCRCRARYLSDRDLEEKGLKPAQDVRILEREPPGNRPVDPLTGETPDRWIQRGVSIPDPLNPRDRLTLWADPGWDHLPGSTGAERRLIDRMLTRADELSNGIRELVLDDLARRAADFVRAAGAAGAAKQTAYILAPTLDALTAAVRQTEDLDRRTADDLLRFALVLDHDRVRHLLTQHGDEQKEVARGQRAIVPDDFSRLPEVLRTASVVKRGTPDKSYSGAPLIEVLASFGGEQWTLILELRRKQGTVSLYSAWIRPSRKAAAPPAE
jgi:SPP1 gp7 family putative phage head morphogenesis protein